MYNLKSLSQAHIGFIINLLIIFTIPITIYFVLRKVSTEGNIIWLIINTI